jgi:diacylglycerol kinase (ATP)
MTAPSHRIGLVANPTAGKGRGSVATHELTGLLRSGGHDIIDLSAHSAGAALNRARAAVAAAAVDVIAVVGGDGMAHLGVNACAGSGIPLAIVPVGTGNDIADSIGLAVGDLRAAADALAALRTRPLDAGFIETPAPVARPWFGGTLYAGFDALVNDRANRWRWPPGQARYTLATLRELPVFRPIPYTVTVDDERIDTEAMLVVVANVPSYGGGMQVTPKARPDDGLFDVLVLHRIPRAEFLRVFPTVFSGGHVGHPAVEIRRGSRVRLEAHGIPVFADGEPFTALPVEARVVPHALDIVVP